MKFRQPFSSRLSGPQRGVTLIEALVALMVMSFGMVALVSLMANLRRSGDIAKQRGEAMRLAQAELATQRSFVVIDKNDAGLPATTLDYVNNVVTLDGRDPITPDNSNTSFTVYRAVTPLIKDSEEPRAKTVSVTVAWKDRSGKDDALKLDTIISQTDPAFAGATSLTPPANGIRMPDARHPAIPVSAKDLGNKRSAFRPPGGDSTVWVFNNATGVIVGKCSIKPAIAVSTLTPADVESCTSTTTVGYLISGTIRFSNTSPANPTTPEALAQSLSVYLNLTPSQFTIKDSNNKDVLAPGGGYSVSPNYECFSDAPSSPVLTQSFVNYNCIVYPNSQTPRNWWGQVLLSGLDIGTTATRYRVCRYSADYNGNGYTFVAKATNGYAYLVDDKAAYFLIDNEEHPDTYRGVSYSLARQNFLVVRGDVSCPTAPAVDPSNGIFIDYSTVQLQPS